MGDVLVLKSGSEFREFSEITVTFPEGNGRSSSHNHAHRRPLIDVVRHEVTGSVTPDPQVDAVVQHYLGKVWKGLSNNGRGGVCHKYGLFIGLRNGDC